jgi:3',5'-cyclic AMP phosphodiesterase CpdA
LGQELLAARRPAAPNSWALLADTHLAADKSRVEHGVNMTDHFIAVSRELLSLQERPAGVVVLGDCALDNGENGDYAALTTLLKALRADGFPIHLALGNHDNRERFWDVLHEEQTAKRPLPDRQVALLRTKLANWFILDSLEKTRSTPGLVGREQLDWLAKALDANLGKPALILVHHNPGLTGNLGLKDTAAFFDIIRPRRQVKAYIYGHTHAWGVQQDYSGIHFINLPPVAYVFQAGQPSGWVHATLERSGLRLELRCVDPSHKAHGQVVNLEWRA